MLKNMLSGGISLMQSTTLLFNLKVASSNNQWALGSIPLLVMVKIHPFGELVGSDLPPPPPPQTPPKKKNAFPRLFALSKHKEASVALCWNQEHESLDLGMRHYSRNS